MKAAIDLNKIYSVGDIKVKFDASQWTWIAVNSFGFGIDSDDNVKTLIKRLKNETIKTAYKMQNVINEILKRNKTKSDMAYLIHNMDFHNDYGASYWIDYNKKEDIKNELIKLLNTDKIYRLKSLRTLSDLFETLNSEQK